MFVLLCSPADDIPDILDTFAVLHIDDCGDVVEKVSEVTPSHVKLTEPNFSIIAALIRFIFPPKISCYMLMYYKPNTSFLKLHVYLIRQDPALEQVTEHLNDEKQDKIPNIRTDWQKRHWKKNVFYIEPNCKNVSIATINLFGLIIGRFF